MKHVIGRVGELRSRAGYREDGHCQVDGLATRVHPGVHIVDVGGRIRVNRGAVSVIGCEAREPNSPKFDGESTCNFADLEIERLDEFLAVGFHPNHTGVLVPSGFKD